MPVRASTICAVCKVRIKQGDRCEKHKKAGIVSGWAETERLNGNANKRGYGAKWRKVRVQALRRDSYLCQVCYESGRLTEATEVDHIVNKASGGDWYDLENLQSICSECHKAKTKEESKNGR